MACFICSNTKKKLLYFWSLTTELVYVLVLSNLCVEWFLSNFREIQHVLTICRFTSSLISGKFSFNVSGIPFRGFFIQGQQLSLCWITLSIFHIYWHLSNFLKLCPVYLYLFFKSQTRSRPTHICPTNFLQRYISNSVVKG